MKKASILVFVTTILFSCVLLFANGEKNVGLRIINPNDFNDMPNLKELVIKLKEMNADNSDYFSCLELMEKIASYNHPRLSEIFINALQEKKDSEAFQKSTFIRVASAEILSKIKGSFSVCLIEALNDRSPEVRTEVATSLGKLKDKNAVSYLVKTLQKEKDTGVSVAVINALAQIPSKSCITALQDFLNKTNNSTLKIAAGRALYTLTQDENYLNLLFSYLKSENPEVRRFAVSYLRIKPISKKALDKLKKSLTTTLNDKDPIVRKFSLDTIEWNNIDLSDKIIPLLNDEKGYVKAKAIVVLGKLPSPSSVPLIAEHLKDETFQTYAINSLKDTGLKEAIEPLLKRYEETSDINKLQQIYDALIVLSKASDKETREKIMQLSKHKQSLRSYLDSKVKPNVSKQPEKTLKTELGWSYWPVKQPSP